MKNKKGLINFPLGLIGFFVLMLVIVSLVSLEDGGKEASEVMEGLEESQSNMAEQFAINDSHHVVVNVVYSFMGFVTYSSMEITKLAVDYGAKNPDVVNPRILLWLVIFALLAPILIVLFKILVILFLLFKEYFQSKKEKRLRKQWVPDNE